MYFHVEESNIFVDWGKITPDCALLSLSTTISDCISHQQDMRLSDRSSQPCQVTWLHDSGAGEDQQQSVQCKMRQEWSVYSLM